VESPLSSQPSQSSPESRPLTGPEQQRVRLCVGLLALLGTGSLIGVASFAFLATEYPLLLIALSPLGRHLILVAPVVDPFTFAAIGLARRTLFYLPCFGLGRTLGPNAIRWIEARAARFAGFVRWIERIFGLAPRVVVAALPGPTVSALAGISGMPLGLFLSLAAAGTLARMGLYLYFGDWLSQPIDAVRSFLFEYRVPLTAAILALYAAQRWRRARRARSTP
jgi:hypothetical protein